MASKETNKYRDAVKELLFLQPQMGAIARSMGEPIFDDTCETAYITFDEEKKVRFGLNPEFAVKLNREELASVIAHEAHHLVKLHLDERLDDKTYPFLEHLTTAQEVIVNDTIEHVHHMALPEGLMRGEDILGKDCSQYTTKQVYDMLVPPEEEQPEPDDIDEDQDEEPEEPEDEQSGGGDQEDEDGSPDDGEDNSDGNEDEEGDGEDSDSEDGDENEQDEGDGEEEEDESDEEEDDDDGEDEEKEHEWKDEGKPRTPEQKKDAPPLDAKPKEGKGEPGEAEEQPKSPGTSCGGMRVGQADAKEFLKAVDAVMEDAAASTGKTVAQMMTALTNSGGGFDLSADNTQRGYMSRERMNWNKLLARINPDVLDSRGQMQTKNNWMKTNRRMISTYPKVILPRIEPKVNKNVEGHDVPSLIVALDLSGSIPIELVDTLQGMLRDIPGDKINAYPCTWSSNLTPYDPERPYVSAGGGTEIEAVVSYTKEIERTTGTKPYVLVITDGFFQTISSYPGTEWYFMAVARDPDMMEKCRYHATVGKHPNNVYCVDEFRIR